MLAEDMSAPSNGVAVTQSNGSSNISQADAVNGMKKALTVNGATNGSHQSGRGQTYFGHNREEVTRILIQALSGMGYQEAAEMVSKDSGYSLESPTVAALRASVLTGDWAEAERLLNGAALSEARGSEGNGLVLAVGADRDLMRFWLRQQKYLELLEKKDAARALMVLRGELTPLYQDTTKLHFLSSLLMCPSTEDLMKKARWDGAQGESRRELLSDLSKCISPSVMLPENRLAVLLQHVKQSQIDTCIYHTEATSPSLYSDHVCDRRDFPSEVALDLEIAEGEVWQVQFSHNGAFLAACGGGDSVVIWETKTFHIIQELPGHDKGVGNISWSPNDTMIVTCSQDRYARVWEAKTGMMLKRLPRFDEPVSGCVWAADNNSFVIGTLSTNGITSFTVDSDEVIEWKKTHRVQDLCGSPDGKWLIAADDQKSLHIYNAATRQLEYNMDVKALPTSVSVSKDSKHLLVNKRDGEAILIDLHTRTPVQKYLGHTGGDYLIRSTFGGANESFVACGSEDGNILIWHKNIGAAVERLHGHVPRCNAVAWNPADSCMLASCGDDHRVKIWTNKTRCHELRLSYAQAHSSSITHHGHR